MKTPELYFSTNGTMNTRKKRDDNPIVCLYENLLYHRGIHIIPMTELAFETCYSRYKELGGKTKFKFNIDFELDNLI